MLDKSPLEIQKKKHFKLWRFFQFQLSTFLFFFVDHSIHAYRVCSPLLIYLIFFNKLLELSQYPWARYYYIFCLFLMNRNTVLCGIAYPVIQTSSKEIYYSYNHTPTSVIRKPSFCSVSVGLRTGSNGSLPDQFVGSVLVSGSRDHDVRIVDIQRIRPFFFGSTFRVDFWSILEVL